MTDKQRDAIDAADLAYLRLSGRVAVLSRLSELLETTARPGAIGVDFAGVREEAFWFGIRELTDEIAGAADAMHKAVGALQEPMKGGAS